MSQPAKCQASDLLTHSCVPCRDSSRHLEFSHFGEKMYAVFALHERRGGGAGGFACQMPEHVRISQTTATFSPAGRVCLCHLASLGFTATTATGRILLSLPPTVFWTAAHPAQNGSKWR